MSQMLERMKEMRFIRDIVGKEPRDVGKHSVEQR